MPSLNFFQFQSKHLDFKKKGYTCISWWIINIFNVINFKPSQFLTFHTVNAFLSMHHPPPTLFHLNTCIWFVINSLHVFMLQYLLMHICHAYFTILFLWEREGGRASYSEIRKWICWFKKGTGPEIFIRKLFSLKSNPHNVCPFKSISLIY